MKYLTLILNDGGGLGKSELAKLLVDLTRSVEGRSVGVFDGDPKNHSLLTVCGERDANGALLDPEKNDLLTGCRTIDLRDPEKSSAEMIKALEEIQPDLLLADGAGGSAQNLGLMIMKSGTPEEFVGLLEELGYTLILASPQIPQDGGKTIEALSSTKRLVDQYVGFTNVHFHIALNRWNGDVDGDYVDHRFDYWFNSTTRKTLLDAGKLSESKIVELPPEVMSVTSAVPVPYSRFIDPEFAKVAQISIRPRLAIKKHRDLFRSQVEADPVLKKAYLDIA